MDIPLRNVPVFLYTFWHHLLKNGYKKIIKPVWDHQNPTPTLLIVMILFFYANGRIAIPAAGDYFPLFTTTTHRLVMFPLFTVMRTLPAFFALITPFLETVAIFLLDDLNEMLSVLPALTFTFKR